MVVKYIIQLIQFINILNEINSYTIGFEWKSGFIHSSKFEPVVVLAYHALCYCLIIILQLCLLTIRCRNSHVRFGNIRTKIKFIYTEPLRRFSRFRGDSTALVPFFSGWSRPPPPLCDIVEIIRATADNNTRAPALTRAQVPVSVKLLK